MQRKLIARSFGLRLLGWASLALAAAPVAAQQAGLYSGTTSQGQFIQLQISDGPAGGRPLLSFVQVVFQVDCETTGRSSLDGYAVSSAVKLNPAGGFSKQLFTARFFGSMAATYNGVNGFTGTTSLYGAKLLPALPPRAENCNATGVSFAVTRAPSAQRLPLTLDGLDQLVQGHWAADGRLRDERSVSPGH